MLFRVPEVESARNDVCLNTCRRILPHFGLGLQPILQRSYRTFKQTEFWYISIVVVYPQKHCIAWAINSAVYIYITM